MNFRLPVLVIFCLFWSVAVNAEQNEWDYARPEMTQEAILELRELPEAKYWPSTQVRFFASCVVEKRIQMGKKVGCNWEMKPGVTIAEHLAVQFQCFEDGGYGVKARQEHGDFCAVFMREYSRSTNVE